MLELPCQLWKNSHSLFSIRFTLNITKLKLLNQYKSLIDNYFYLGTKFSSGRTVVGGTPSHFYLFFLKLALPKHITAKGTSILCFPNRFPWIFKGTPPGPWGFTNPHAIKNQQSWRENLRPTSAPYSPPYLIHVTLQVLDLCYCTEIFTLFEYELM